MGKSACHSATANAYHLFGAVVGGRDGAVGEENEEESPTVLDGVLQLLPAAWLRGMRMTASRQALNL
jgi:hypothetical protein